MYKFRLTIFHLRALIVLNCLSLLVAKKNQKKKVQKKTYSSKQYSYSVENLFK